MKVAVLAESPADRKAVETLVSALSSVELEFLTAQPRTGGFNSVVSIIKPTLLDLYYNQRGDGLIVVVDGDQTPVEVGNSQGRVALVQGMIREVEAMMKPGPGLKQLHTAIGVAVPSIEAWLLFGEDSGCTEAGWVLKENEGNKSPVEISRLKQRLYSTDRPSLELETNTMVERCQSLISSNSLDALEKS